MVASRVVKIFSIAVLATFLVSSVEPTGDKCPPSIKTDSDGDTDVYVVMLKNNDKSTVEDHLGMMEMCYGKRIQSVKPNDQLSKKDLSDKSDKNVIWNFSVDKVISGYSGHFTDKFVKNQLSKMDDIKLIEKESKFETTFAVPQRRAVAKNPPKNLDRIDQAKGFDGKFAFPDSAGKGVNIFVVDTGIRITHNEFEDRAQVGGSFCDGCNDDDENGHGTQVASVAAGKTFGVARQANLIAVRVLDAKGAGNNVDVINGLAFVGEQHKNAKNKNSVVNMSLGGGFSAAVNSAVKDLTDAGVHVAVAAGNDAEDACKSSPSSELSAITVGATELDNDQITDFSNIGKCLDIFAPGRDIIGAGIKNDDDTIVFSGTSQATPHVAGTLALLIAENGNKSPADMAKELTDLSTKGVVEGVGGGNDLQDSPDNFLRTPAP